MLKKLLAESDVICDWSDPFAGEHGRFPRGPFPDHPAIPASTLPTRNSPSGAGSQNLDALRRKTAATSRDLCFLQSDVRSLYISHDKPSMSGS